MSDDASDGRPGSEDLSSESEDVSSPGGRDERGEGAAPRQSLLGDLIRRRVPQVLAGYLGVTWTLFEFMKWLTNQYLISPHLGQAILFGLLLFLPSVVLITYRHGRPGPDPWTRFERIGVIGNVVFVALVLLVGFGGAELGSMVRPATVTATAKEASSRGGSVADTGRASSVRQRRRSVPKKEFRKRVALFHFDAGESTPADTALRRTVPAALHADLEQDLFVSLFPPDRFDGELRERGYHDGFNVPLGLKQEIAQRVNAHHILSGHVGRTDDGPFRVRTRLHKTKTGEQIAEHTFEGEDLFALVDRASRQLKKDLGLPRAHLERATDLPVTQVFTPSLAAAKHFARGRYLDAFVERQGRKALEAYRRATEADSTFAAGYIGKGGALLELGRREEAAQAFRSAQRHSYRLPETRKYWLKALRLFRIKNQPEAALRVCQRWTSLYPYDVMAWRLKAVLHEELHQPKALVESYRRAAALAPENKRAEEGLIRGLLRADRVGEAAQHAESFAEAHPRDATGPLLVGTVRWMQGRLEEAETALRRARSLDSSQVRTELLALHRARGQFDEALAMISEKTREGNGLWAAFQRWRQYWLRGKIDRSTEAFDSLRTDLVQADADPLALNPYVCEYYDGIREALVHRAYERLQGLEEERGEGPPRRAVAIELGLAQCGIAAGRFAEAHRHLGRADSIARREMARSGFRIDYVRARLREKQGAFEQAAKSYEAFLKAWSGYVHSLTWAYRLPRLHLARSYEKIGQERKAEEKYRAALTLRPAYPRLNYHYARFLVQQGRTETARTHLRRALDAWAPADPDFSLKQRAEALARSLGITQT